MITPAQKDKAYAALRTAGFEPALIRELLAGPGTLRDGFAGRAMAELMATPDGMSAPPLAIARAAYNMADTMMTARGER